MKITKKIVRAVFIPILLMLSAVLILIILLSMHAVNQQRQKQNSAIGNARDFMERAMQHLYHNAVVLSTNGNAYGHVSGGDDNIIEVIEESGADCVCFVSSTNVYERYFDTSVEDLGNDENVKSFMRSEKDTDIKFIRGKPFILAKASYEDNQFDYILLAREMDKLFLNELDRIIDGKTTVIPSAENDSEKYILELSEAAALKIDMDNGRELQVAIIALSVFVVLVVPLSVVLLWYVNRYINKPILALTDKIRGISYSDKGETYEETYCDDEEFLELIYTIDSLITTNSNILDRLRKGDAELRLILDTVVECILGLDLEGNITYCNKRCLNMLGYDCFTEILGRNIKEITGKDIQFYENNQPNICRFSGKDETLEVELYRYPKIEDNRIVGYVVAIIDITEKRKMEHELTESQRSTEFLLTNIMGMVYRCRHDENWTVLYVSEGCYKLTGYKAESFINNRDVTLNDIIAKPFRERIRQRYEIVLANREVFREEYIIVTADGSEKWVLEQEQGVYDDEGNVIAIEGLIIDISDQKAREKEIEYLSYHDALTGVYNRIYLDREKKRLMESDMHPISVIVGDIDGLKFINDAFGHAVGDELIKHTANILKSCLREGDVIARVGGDEFNILLPKTDESEAHRIMKNMQREIKKFSSENMRLYNFTVSLGYSTKYTREDNLNDCIKQADEYMYKRKLLERHSSHSAVIASMRETMNARGIETEEHCRRLADLSREMGMAMDLSEKEVNELVLLSSLHDIGKVGINDAIVKKATTMTNEEFEEMKKHPMIGYRIAMATHELQSIAPYILTHHERWDGLGYPQGLKGEEIPKASRIFSVLVAYDVLTCGRPYKQPVSKEEALKEIEENAGLQFDPAIAKIFVDWMRKQH